MQHVLKTQQFSREWLKDFFWRTTELKRVFETSTNGRARLRASLKGRLMHSVFCEASTRTRFSFESAAHHLGMDIVATENGSEFSSLIKGESIEHMIEVLCRYHPDVIILRHKEEGVAERVAPIASRYRISVINGGDGAGQHPTQALLDVYTINSCIGSVDGITVVVGGDLTYGRTAKSLVYLLSKFERVRFIFISPPQLRMDAGVVSHLLERDIPFREVSVENGTEISEACREANVVYWTRTQSERITDSVKMMSIAKSAWLYQITVEHANLLGDRGAILLHPLPINGEVENAVDHISSAKYFEQAGNGLFVRMALLQEILQA